MVINTCVFLTVYVYVFRVRREFFMIMTRVPFVSNTFVGVQETIASSYKGGGGEGTKPSLPGLTIEMK